MKKNNQPNFDEFQTEMIDFCNTFYNSSSQTTIKTIQNEMSHCLHLIPDSDKPFYRNTIDFFTILFSQPFDVIANAQEFRDISKQTVKVFKKHKGTLGCRSSDFLIAFVKYKHKRIDEIQLGQKGIRRLYG